MIDASEVLGLGGASLSAVQRILLTTDGRVTDIIEAYAGERVAVVKLAESLNGSKQGYPDLELEQEEEVLYRDIMIRGTETGANFLYGASVIAAQRVSPEMLTALTTTEKPLGRLLVEQRVETFREVLRWSREPAGELAMYFDLDPSATLMSRTYRVVSNERPVMLITEKFPETYFRAA